MLPNYTESIILKRWRHLKHLNSIKCVHVTKCGQRMNSLSQTSGMGWVCLPRPPLTSRYELHNEVQISVVLK